MGREYVYVAHATDLDANPLAYSLDTFPPGMTINAATGVILWTPGATQVGTHPVLLRVSDGQGGSDTQDFSIVVTATEANQAPQVISTPTKLITVPGRDYAYDLVGFDADNDPLTLAVGQRSAGHVGRSGARHTALVANR